MVPAAGALLLSACTGGEAETIADDPRPTTTLATTSTTTTSTSTSSTTTPPSTAAPPPAPADDAGRAEVDTEAPAATTPPQVASDPGSLATQIIEVEGAVRDPRTAPEQLAHAAHLQQLTYRVLAASPDWDDTVHARLPDELRPVVHANVAARRELRGMHSRLSERVPAWRIVDPRPIEELIAHYLEAQAIFGVGWEYLAAIHLVETAMGRVDGVSSAGALGPMQFMPGTWEAFGEGDVRNPRDAILAAGRYLAHSGAPGDMHAALFSYNRHNNYVRAIQHYASVIRADPAAYRGYHGWQVYLLTVAGDLWLPSGYHEDEPVPVEQFLARRN
jgi:membrane-bound lytic murein transglycosylase B